MTNPSMTNPPVRYRAAMVVAVVLFYGLPIYWFINFRFDRYATHGIGRPWLSWVVAREAEGGIPDRAYRYLIFDTHADGAEWFAQRYAGVPLAKFETSYRRIRYADRYRSWGLVVEGIPWDLTRLKNGRFYRRDDAPGFLAIDRDTNRVFVFQ